MKRDRLPIPSVRLAFIVPGAPVACARPRATLLRGKGGKPILANGQPIVRAFVPSETTNFEERVMLFAGEAAERCPEWREVFERKIPLRVMIHVVRQAWRGDWDNYAKGVVDGIAKSGVVFTNDNLVVQALVSIETDKLATPRTEVVIEPSEPGWVSVTHTAEAS